MLGPESRIVDGLDDPPKQVSFGMKDEEVDVLWVVCCCVDGIAVNVLI